MDVESWQKEQISIAFLTALTAQNGLTVGSWSHDKDGVDATIRRGAIMADIQLKCTQNLRSQGQDYAFDLDVETYDKLRVQDRCAPGYLAVLVVPTMGADWIVHESNRTILNCVGYFSCIQDMPPTSNTTQIAIRLAAMDRLNSAALDKMIEHSERRFLGMLMGTSHA